jgi:DnaJ-class molecular chaperone
MVKLINTKCPTCGAVLELPDNIDSAFCIHCGEKVIMGRGGTLYKAQKAATACPECSGKGHFICHTCRGGMRCLAYYPTTRGGMQVVDYCYNGWCPKCKGRGQTIETLLKETCNYCHGARVCPYCRGTNKCSTCGGTGTVACRACQGSGFKVYR